MILQECVMGRDGTEQMEAQTDMQVEIVMKTGICKDLCCYPLAFDSHLLRR